MSALKDYNEWRKGAAPFTARHTTHHADCGCLAWRADAMRDELLATIESLTVCGNCGRGLAELGRILCTAEGISEATSGERGDRCRYDESMWTPLPEMEP